MIVTIGDLVEDVVVHLHERVAFGDDTAATIRRRAGGSAANTAIAVAALGREARLVVALGDDELARRLGEAVHAAGVELAAMVVRGGRTGTVVALVDHSGERTMLTDRGCAPALDRLPEGWDAGMRALHVPMYALAEPAMAAVVATATGAAHTGGATVSVDVSSARLVGELGGRAVVLARLADLGAHILLANEQEAAALDLLDHPPDGALTIVKRGARPAVVVDGGASYEVPAEPLTRLVDSTGAGDAFAAGVLVAHGDGLDAAAAVRAGHRSAARVLAAR